MKFANHKQHIKKLKKAEREAARILRKEKRFMTWRELKALEESKVI